MATYREDSKKIFEIINRYAKEIEKGGTDEAFLNVTKEVEFRMKYDSEIDFKAGKGTPDYWSGSNFMPFKKDANGIA